MTVQTILYFSSILLTCTITGFLAWYAWRQSHVTGARSYAYMVLAESLLALTEIGAMLVSTQPQAAFWFSLRVPFTAIIPVFWLFFIMEYSGRSDWLSKPVRAALFAIPLITQVVMVTSSLHGLWLVQDVGFEKIGPFWIADTSARIPGLWYLVHTFYSTILLVVGAGALVVAAWSKPRILLGQALLVSLGALTALGMALVGVFNLLPELHFNPFVPGIGFSTVCYALAIFRFQFLKRPPQPESGARLTNLKPEEKGSLAVLVFIFILFTSVLAASVYLTYQNYERQFRAQVDSQLESIASLKADELQDWRAERLADANLFYRNENFSERVRDYLENPQDADAQAKLLTWLEKITVFPGYDRIFLLDTRGVERLSLPAAPDPDAVPTALIEQAAECLASDQIIFLDFHRHSDAGSVHLSLLVPVYAPQDNQPLGTLVLRIDPNVYLYPFLQRWPVPSASAETLLLRREGQEAVYLNPLHSQPDAALDLRFPLTETQVPAVRAALGETGVVEGLDYRGVEVIADIRAVPDSPWFLVSKMDTAEVYAPLRERLWQTILLFSALILAAGAGLTLVWRQQRMLYYRAQAGITDALRASEEKFRLAFETSPDSVAITRARDGMFVSVNKGFEQITGYTRAEVIGKTSLEINIWKDPEDRRKIVEGLQARGEARDYEAPFLTRDGEIIGLMSAVIIQLDGEPHILNITRDITARKQAEEALRQSIRLNSSIMLAAQDIIVLKDENFIYRLVNPAMCNLLGKAESEIIGKTDFDLFPYELAIKYRNDDKSIIESGQSFSCEEEVSSHEGIRYVSTIKAPVLDENNECQGIVVITRDITERKQAEEALRASEELYRLLTDNISDTVWLMDMTLINIYISPSVVKLRGYTLEELNAVPLEQQMTAESLERVMQAFADSMSPERLSQRGQPITPTLELEFYKKDGTTFWSENTFTLIRDADGTPVNVLGVGRDITARKQAEQAILVGEKRYHRVLDAMIEGCQIIDYDWRYVYLNEVAANQGKYRAEELLNRTMMEIYPGIEETEMFSALKRCMEDRAPSRMENRFVYSDGNIGWFELSIQPAEEGIFVLSVDITERKQAEQALRESEKLLREIAANYPNSYISIVNKDLTIGFTSGQEFKKQGLETASFIGLTLEQVFGEHTPLVLENYLKAFGGAETEFELFINNQYQWYRVMPLVSEGDKIDSVLAVVENITGRRQSEIALQQAEARYRALVEQIPAIIYRDSVEHPGQTLYISPQIQSVFGYEPGDWMADNDFWAKIMHPDDRERVLADYAQANSTGQSFTAEYRLAAQDGREVWVRDEAALIYDPSGNPLFWQGVLFDITERKQAEEKLIVSEVRYRRLFEAAKDGILILDAETGIVTDANPFLVEMLGLPQEEICGKGLWELGFFKDIAANKANFLELQKTEFIRYEDLPLETADGRRVQVEFVSNVYQVDHHKVIQCNIRDITERKQAEEQLARYTEKLEEMVDERTRSLRDAQEQLIRQERLSMLGQVAGSIGHELRNPLGVISNAIYFLKLTLADSSDKVKEYLDIIEHETLSSDKIVTELLDFTRIKSMERRQISIPNLADQVFERYPAPASVRAALEIPADLPEAFADPYHVTQILGNLLTNAYQAMPEGGQLSITASVYGDMIQITVRDTGVGIPPENLQKIFEPLFTTKARGIGLGLAVSQKLAEANSGRIEVQSEPGTGSQFTLCLPVYKESF